MPRFHIFAGLAALAIMGGASFGDDAGVNPEPTALRQLRELQAKKDAADAARKKTAAEAAAQAQGQADANARAQAEAQARAQADYQAKLQQYQQQVQAAQEAAAHAAPANVDDADARDMNELVQQKQKELQPYQALNAMNPLVPKPAQTPGAADPAAAVGMSPEQAAGLEKFQALLQKPYFAAFAGAMQNNVKDPEFMKAIGTLSKNPNMKWMYAALLVYTIVFALLKRRALAATDRFLARLALKGCFFVMFLGGYLMISYAVLGDPLFKILTGMSGALGVAARAWWMAK